MPSQNIKDAVRIFFAVPTWEQLSGLRTTQVLKVSYLGSVLVPLVGLIRTIFPNEADHGLPEFVAWAYFGSLSLAIGHVLNEGFCPLLIKTYGCFSVYHKALRDYAQQRADIFNSAVSTIAARLKINVREEFSDLDDDGINTISLAVSDQVPEASPENTEPPSTLLGSSEADWSTENNKRLVLRSFIILFYFIGSMIIYYLALRTGRSVAEAALF